MTSGKGVHKEDSYSTKTPMKEFYTTAPKGEVDRPKLYHNTQNPN